MQILANYLSAKYSEKNSPRFQKAGRMKKKWYKTGKAPDYRFSLANERTFLAWIRTSLALLAGAIGISQFVDGLPMLRNIIAAAISAIAGIIAIYAYWRWAHNEHAMRQGKDLPYTPFLRWVSITALLLAIILTYFILV